MRYMGVNNNQQVTTPYRGNTLNTVSEAQVKSYLDTLIADEVQQDMQRELGTLEKDTAAIKDLLASITLDSHVKILAAKVLAEIAGENALKLQTYKKCLQPEDCVLNVVASHL